MVEQILKEQFVQMVYKYHYSNVLPKLTKYYLGDSELNAVMSLGWGVRPLHTIRKLFPSLKTKDYFEIGKMCLNDDSPKNSESIFISKIIKWLKKNRPDIKILFTWADGMLGKAGYIYQASNFFYGGYIWTDTYLSFEGEKIHPRSTGAIGGRPSMKKMKDMQWKQYRGKQFRYCYFLCNKREKKKLLKESNVEWTLSHPKDVDLEWKERTENGWIECGKPPYNMKANSFSKNSRKTKGISEQCLLFNDFD